MRQVVIVGASLAAVHAIESLRENGYQDRITLVGAERHLPYDRPPLSKDALRLGPDVDKLLLKQPAWYASHNVDLRLGRPAVGLDARRRRVQLAGGAHLDYDGLILATGSRARRFPLFDSDAHAYTVRTLDDATALHTQFDAGSHLAVIGAGFIGLEVAATASALGMDVSVVEAAPTPLTRVLGSEAGHWFKRRHESHGVTMYCENMITQVETNGCGYKLHLRDGTVLAADVVLAGVGATPATDWLRGSGVAVSDGVVCDSQLRTSAPGVVAAGDIARWYNPLFGEQMRVEQWSNAVEQGRKAARTLLGHAGPLASIPYFWSDQFDAKIRFAGRTDGAEHIHMRQDNDTSMVVLFGAGGLIRGALCVNEPRKLARYRAAIARRTPWNDVIAE
ncbi:NAD(P)/FAD-dependent oxidoreductase [Mycobacterium sp. E2479]|uniref:NAD(P)/FAD-dependent oxidoreductase n=1 Tax=Mycobacterium sp. E2479 TaxID=1834134 RepID=UPI0009EE5AF0|nr:FAD-dependent oxidoreductase [Mycobacterium sp. E2479]